MEPLGLSSGAAGLISLGISVCQGLLDYYRSWKYAEDQVAYMYESIPPSHRFDFIYWDDRNQDVEKTDRQVVMEELNKRETYMMSMRA